MQTMGKPWVRAFFQITKCNIVASKHYGGMPRHNGSKGIADTCENVVLTALNHAEMNTRRRRADDNHNGHALASAMSCVSSPHSSSSMTLMISISIVNLLFGIHDVAIMIYSNVVAELYLCVTTRTIRSSEMRKTRFKRVVEKRRQPCTERRIPFLLFDYAKWRQCHTRFLPDLATARKSRWIKKK